MSDVYNEAFDEIVPEGEAGGQHHFGIFYQDRRGLFQRLVMAEGHEVAYNPEVEEKNLIGMKAVKSLVRKFNETFEKGVLITKGEKNYDFFRDFKEKKYTGKNAEVRIIMVDFMQNVKATAIASDRTQRYKAYWYNCTTTVDSGNFTDGTLSVNFAQATDTMPGVADYDKETESAVFTASNTIPITAIVLNGERDADGAPLDSIDVMVKAGGEVWVSVDFEPFGANDTVIATSSDTSKCTTEITRSSVVITGIETGTASVEVKDAGTQSVTATIEVTVS